MKTSRKILLLAAISAMALQLVFSGSAGATMNPDGAQHNGTTGVWELPAYTDIFGCYVGGGTVVDAASRFDCRNTAIAETLQSVCVASTAITPPVGWIGVANGTGRWSACSEGGVSATNCGANGGTLDVFTRCSKQIVNSDCNDLGTTLSLTVTAAGTATTPTCTATSTANPGLTAAICAGYTGTAASGAPYVGSAAVSGTGVTTCTIYIGDDATACAAVGGGTVSTTNTDETRGYCGGNTIDKFLNTDTAANPMGGINADWSTASTTPATANRRRNCLKCHQPAYMDSEVPSYAGGVAKYINASHRNASRKITPGKSWAQINGTPETFGVFTNYAGRNINWLDGTIETAPGSTFYTDWYWYWGYYFEDPTAGSDIAENTTGTTGVPWNVITSRGAGGFQACMYCHATGFTAENTQIATKEPERSFPGSAWDGSVPYDPAPKPVGNGAINLRASFNDRSNVDDSVFVPSSADCAALGGTIVPTSVTNPIPVCRIPSASITQNNCVKGGNSIPGTPEWTGAWQGSWAAATGCTVTTAFNYTSWDEFGVLCSNCHNSAEPNHQNNGPRKNINWDGTALEKAVSINAVCLQCHAKAGSGNGQNTALDSEPLANRADISGSHPNYHGSEFMNSPHARFSGTYVQVTDTTQYDSAFTTLYGGCNGCHEPHGSVRENLLDPVLMGGAVAEEGITATCASCHATYTDADTITVTPANTNHPTGADTPGCETCHMPGGKHVFRIAADNSTTGADGTYAMAAWNTATTVCQQCHSATGTAFALTAAQAAAGAAGMHTGGSAVNSDCLVCHVAGNAVGAPEITPGTNHHGVHSDCAECHPNGHNGTVPDPASNAFCTNCHTNTGAYAAHHATANVVAACNSCHTIPGVTVPAATNANCLACHNAPKNTTAGGTVRLVNQGVDHHIGTCTTCHNEGPAYLAINAMPVPVLTTTLSPAGAHNPLPYWGIGNSLRDACLTCHATSQVKSGGGTTGVIAPSGAADNHHGGHRSVPGTTFGGVSEANGSRGDNDPGMACVGCHGKGAIVSGDNTTGYVVKITSSGLSTSTVAAQNSRVNTSGLCLGCHEVVQAGAEKDHHVGECISCHRADGTWSGTFGAGVGTGNAELNTSCLTCHATAQGTAGAISSDLTAMKHGTGGGTPASFPNAACATCHKAPTAAPVSWPGVAPVVDASCGQCHGGSAGSGATTNGAMFLDLAYLTSWAAGMHSPATTLPPTPGYTGLTTNTPPLAVSFTDNSTDNNGNAQNTLAIYINWGDGQVSSGVGGAVFSHTYATGGVYNVIHKATDSGGRMKSEFISVTVTSAGGSVVKHTLTVTVVGNQAIPLAMPKATVYLKKETARGFIQVKYGRTNAAGQITFTKLVDGVNYKIVVYKSGLDFDGTKTARQTQAKSDAFLMDMNRTVLVEQGAAATNGPVTSPWRGTNGGVTVFTPAP